MNAPKIYPPYEELRCAWCYPSEHGKHGEIKKQWSAHWQQMIPVCRKHAQADGMQESEPDADMGRMEHDDCGDN